VSETRSSCDGGGNSAGGNIAWWREHLFSAHDFLVDLRDRRALLIRTSSSPCLSIQTTGADFCFVPRRLSHIMSYALESRLCAD
jgi:hypothetical protein